LALVKSAWLSRPHLLQEKKNGYGVLAYAAMYGYSDRTKKNKEIVAFLIEHGAPFNACDAAYLDQPDELARILEADPDELRLKEKGWTPLHFAAERGSLACTKLLIERGADVNAGLSEGGAPLAQAAHAGPMKTQPAEDVANLLIENGAKVDIFLAAMLGHVDSLKRILDAEPGKLEAENKNGERPLHHAAHNLRLEAARLLLDRGAAVEDGERAKLSPFIWATIHAWDKGGLEMLELLLRHGAELNRPDREGMTALDYAIEYSFPAVQAFLQARNAKAIRHADKIRGPV
jgi:ankyrin repeat protein